MLLAGSSKEKNHLLMLSESHLLKLKAVSIWENMSQFIKAIIMLWTRPLYGVTINLIGSYVAPSVQGGRTNFPPVLAWSVGHNHWRPVAHTMIEWFVLWHGDSTMKCYLPKLLISQLTNPGSFLNDKARPFNNSTNCFRWQRLHYVSLRV